MTETSQSPQPSKEVSSVEQPTQAPTPSPEMSPTGTSPVAMKQDNSWMKMLGAAVVIVLVLYAATQLGKDESPAVEESASQEDEITQLASESPTSRPSTRPSAAPSTRPAQNSASSDWAKYASDVTTDKLLPLTMANKGKFNPGTYTTVPAVLSSDADSIEVYSDFAQTVLRVPRGWYGEDGDDDSGVFRDLEHKLVLRMDFTEVGRDMTSVEELERALKADADFTAAANQLGGATFRKLSSSQLLIDMTGASKGAILLVYTLNPADPSLVHKTSLAAGESTPLTKNEVEEVLEMILDSQRILGIDPSKPNERVEFLDENGLGAWNQ